MSEKKTLVYKVVVLFDANMPKFDKDLAGKVKVKLDDRYLPRNKKSANDFEVMEYFILQVQEANISENTRYFLITKDQNFVDDAMTFGQKNRDQTIFERCKFDVLNNICFYDGIPIKVLLIEEGNRKSIIDRAIKLINASV